MSMQTDSTACTIINITDVVYHLFVKISGKWLNVDTFHLNSVKMKATVFKRSNVHLDVLLIQLDSIERL